MLTLTNLATMPVDLPIAEMNDEQLRAYLRMHKLPTDGDRKDLMDRAEDKSKPQFPVVYYNPANYTVEILNPRVEESTSAEEHEILHRMLHTCIRILINKLILLQEVPEIRSRIYEPLMGLIQMLGIYQGDTYMAHHVILLLPSLRIYAARLLAKDHAADALVVTSMFALLEGHLIAMQGSISFFSQDYMHYKFSIEQCMNCIDDAKSQCGSGSRCQFIIATQYFKALNMPLDTLLMMRPPAALQTQAYEYKSPHVFVLKDVSGSGTTTHENTSGSTESVTGSQADVSETSGRATDAGSEVSGSKPCA